MSTNLKQEPVESDAPKKREISSTSEAPGVEASVTASSGISTKKQKSTHHVESVDGTCSKRKELSPSQSIANPTDTTTTTNNDDNNNDEGPTEVAGTKDPSRVRKKRRKLARNHQEKLLIFAKESQYTGSVVVNEGECSTSGATQPAPLGVSLRVTTSCSLPSKEDKANNPIPSHLSQPLSTQSDGNIQVAIQPLLVLDLNGILCHRIRPHKEPPGAHSYRSSPLFIAATPVIARPFLKEFLTYLDAHFCLAVWTSAKPKTAKQLVAALFPADIANKLLFVWGQSKCNKVVVTSRTGSTDISTATPLSVATPAITEHSDILFEKELHKVWEAFPLWNRFNTLLLDDSPEKCDAFRRNALHPFPMNGQLHSMSAPAIAMLRRNKLWVSDEDNHTIQMKFFYKLVDYWKDQDHQWSTTWNDIGEIQRGPQSEHIWTFLQDNAMEDLGWRQ